MQQDKYIVAENQDGKTKLEIQVEKALRWKRLLEARIKKLEELRN